jgi:hypothetical protein
MSRLYALARWKIISRSSVRLAARSTPAYPDLAFDSPFHYHTMSEEERRYGVWVSLSRQDFARYQNYLRLPMVRRSHPTLTGHILCGPGSTSADGSSLGGGAAEWHAGVPRGQEGIDLTAAAPGRSLCADR